MSIFRKEEAFGKGCELSKREKEFDLQYDGTVIKNSSVNWQYIYPGEKIGS